MHRNVHCSTYLQKLSQGSNLCPSTGEWIEMWYIHSGIVLIHKNNAICMYYFIIIILSEVSQKQISYDIVYMWSPKKMIQMNLHTKH